MQSGVSFVFAFAAYRFCVCARGGGGGRAVEILYYYAESFGALRGADVAIEIKPDGDEDTPYGAVKDASEKEQFMVKFFKKVEIIKADIAFLNSVTKKVKELKEEAVNAISSKSEADASDKLASHLGEATKKINSAKQLLKEIENETKTMESKKSVKPSEIRIRRNLHTTLTQKFAQVVRVYQQAQMDYKTKMQDKVARQVRVVKPDATYEEIDKVMTGGDTGATYRAAILSKRSITEAFRNVTDKYRDIVKPKKM